MTLPSAVPLSARSRGVLALAALAGGGAFCWPLLLPPGTGSASLAAFGSQVPLLFAAVLALVLTVVASQLSAGDLDVKALALLGVLSAIGAALRPLGTGIAGIETVFFLVVMAGRVFGPGFGFALGSTTLFASALLTGGVGPWLPHQMLGAGFVGLGAGLLPRARGAWEVTLLAGYGTLSAFAFGWLMDLSFWPFTLGLATELSWDPQGTPWTNLHRFVLYNLATSTAWNLGRALTNVVLIALLGPGLLVVLRRAARRARFLEPAPTRADRAQARS